MDISWGIAICSFVFALYFGWKTYQSRKLANWHETQLFEQSNDLRYELEQSQAALRAASAQVERMQRLHSEIVSQQVRALQDEIERLGEAVKAGKETEARLEKGENEAKRTALEREETLKKQIQTLKNEIVRVGEQRNQELIVAANEHRESKERESVLLQKLNRLTGQRKAEEDTVNRAMEESQECGESLEARCEFLKTALIHSQKKNEESLKQISRAETKNEQFVAELQSLHGDLSRLLTEKNNASLQIAELQQSLSKSELLSRKLTQEMTAKQNEYFASLKRQENATAAVQRANSELTAQVANMNQEKSVLSSEIRAMQSSKDSLQYTLMAERKSNAERIAAMDKIRSENAALMKENREMVEKTKNAEQWKRNVESVSKKFTKMQRDSDQPKSDT